MIQDWAHDIGYLQRSHRSIHLQGNKFMFRQAIASILMLPCACAYGCLRSSQGFWSSALRERGCEIGPVEEVAVGRASEELLSCWLAVPGLAAKTVAGGCTGLGFTGSMRVTTLSPSSPPLLLSFSLDNTCVATACSMTGQPGKTNGRQVAGSCKDVHLRRLSLWHRGW